MEIAGFEENWVSYEYIYPVLMHNEQAEFGPYLQKVQWSKNYCITKTIKKIQLFNYRLKSNTFSSLHTHPIISE